MIVGTPSAEAFMRRVYSTRSAPPVRQRIDLHEAAHCVAGAAIGTPARGASIATGVNDPPGLAWFASTTPHRVPDPLAIQPTPAFADHRGRAFLFAAVRYAGAEAERIAAGVNDDVFYVGDSYDDAEAMMLLSLAFEHATRSSAPRGGCQAYARRLLLANWSAVERVAAALRAHGMIDGEQIERAIAGANCPNLKPVVAGSTDPATTRARGASYACLRHARTFMQAATQ
jgi:hypothetical protein